VEKGRALFILFYFILSVNKAGQTMGGKSFGLCVQQADNRKPQARARASGFVRAKNSFACLQNQISTPLQFAGWSCPQAF
jgi:hypothetical protein